MGASDGTIIGATKIVDNGPPSKRWNLVIMSEGYRLAEMAQFAVDAQQIANFNGAAVQDSGSARVVFQDTQLSRCLDSTRTIHLRIAAGPAGSTS